MKLKIKTSSVKDVIKRTDSETPSPSSPVETSRNNHLQNDRKVLWHFLSSFLYSSLSGIFAVWS